MSKIFNSVEDINKTYGVSLETPANIPNGCNILCYEVEDLFSVKLHQYFQESGDILFVYNHSSGDWFETGSSNLEGKVWYDIDNGYHNLIYLRLKPEQPKKWITERKDNFTPERLLGVETTLGFITTIISDNIVMLSRDSVFWYNVNLLKYYISDDSDETVSLDEYIKLFYNTEDTL